MEPVEISIGFWDSTVSYEYDALAQFIEKKLGIRLKTIPINNYFWENDYREMILSDNVPDLFVSDYLANSNYQYLVDNDYILEITGEVADFPNLKRYMANPYLNYFKKSGKLYCIPRIGFENEALWGLNRVFLVRSDWMEEGGFEMPESFDDFVKLLSYFRYGDPDGNGVDDTRALEIENANKIEALYLSIDPYYCNIERGWIEENAEWKPVWYASKTAEVLAYVDYLYEEGLLYEDFAYINSQQCVQDFLDGKVGCIAYPYLLLLKMFPEHREFVEKSVKILHPWSINGGKPYRFTTVNHWSELYVSKGVDDVKKKKVLELLDYLLSEEFINDINDNGFCMEKSFQFFFEFIQYDSYKYFENGYISLSEPLCEYLDSEIRWVEEEAQPVDYNWNATLLNSEYKNQLPSNIEIHNAIIRAILSDKPIEEAWADEIDAIEKNYPMQKVVEEVTEYMSGISDI